MLDYVALFFLLFATIVIFYAIIAIHDIPYEIAKKRNHPHLEAIHYAGWVSLFTLHVIWPFLWIWATLWDKEKGWGNGNHQKETVALIQLSEISKLIPELEQQNLKLTSEVTELRLQLNELHKKFTQLERTKEI
ncbi:DUF3302 domain-containing protein [Pelistega sp. NLN82]|uniref:DUF3302 domain-containing protein n=1 Tax=Pelistega ratti TaxID=2652177 RepID=A0A6L9Y6G9_9BURK|nr:DUF3302 domain-containing protein [Pelistega ratti]NEN75886.1 DUF3302 domain-containing protein [Pelistega ratti]